MRVAYVSTWQVPCGIAGYTADLVAAMERSGVVCDVVAIDRRRAGQLARQELPAYFDELAARAVATEADVVHVQHEFGFFCGAYGEPEALLNTGRLLRAVNRAGKGLVVTFHSLPPVPAWPNAPWRAAARQSVLQARWRRRVARALAANGGAAVAASHHLRRHLVDSGVAPAAIELVPQGAPPVGPPGPDVAAKEAVGFDSDNRVLAMFGFVSHYKGHDVALRALRRLGDGYRLLIVGSQHPQADDGAFDAILATLGKRPSLAARTTMAGHVPRDEIATYLAAADACLLPYTEPRLATSAAAMWALASRRPVVASDIPVFREMKEDGDCVELVAPGAGNHLAHAVDDLWAAPDRAKQLTENAARYCEARSWRRVAEHHRRLYERVVGGGHASGRLVP